MHGREGERRIHRRHMWPVPAPATSSVAAYDSAAAITADSFSKDGRKICVGDCALFKPPQDSPPFIGIVRRLILGKEKKLSLSVNWLYRPADIKLGKGTSLEAAPNEVFYSFHKDEIPAASLLHPCKVAFLRKGVELPSGISSLVCRRVYDIENKCLWWLTDQDYINERQEEVDQLLDKTRLEMNGAVQSGGRSPKSLTGPTGTPPLRSGSESVQNSNALLPSQVKGKKRDRADQGSDPIKRERVSRVDDTDSSQLKPEQILKSEIAKIADKGGLIDFEGVEKLVQLMQPDSAEKKIDLACRIILVEVIAVTERFDCLERFVQLRGLPVLDEWLQEVNKGKIGGGSSPKESDKSVEEFLLVLLRALDKLPVNLHALQTCYVGKSVNQLRSHKNSEIQKKSRGLVDTWKKRVEAEMNIIDAKPGTGRGGSWPSKSVISEVSNVVTRRNGGSSDVSSKSFTVQSSLCKTPSVKPGSSEVVTKFVSASPGSIKSPASVSSSVGANTKDLSSGTLVGGGSSDLPLSTIKEEKSSSSSQSQNNSQSCSSDHARNGGSCREDARSSTAGSVSVNKTSGSASRHRNSSNGLQAVSGVQKETNLGKFNSSSRNLASDKVSPSRGTLERASDMPLVDHGNSQRLIVRLPNTGRSPAQIANGVSSYDPIATLSKVSPSVQSEKLDFYHDRKVRGKGDAVQVSSASNKNMDLCWGRDDMVRSDEANALSPGALCDERSRTPADGEKLMETSNGNGSPSGVTLKQVKPYGDASFSSMNALVESCVKISEASTTASVVDDIGMNLLASVAAGEISRSDVSPSGSSGRNSPVQEESSSGNDARSRHLDGDSAQSGDLANDGENGGAMLEQGNSLDPSRVKNESPYDASNASGDSKVASISCEGKMEDCSRQLNSSSTDLQQNGCGSYLKCDRMPSQVNDASLFISSEDATTKGNVESEGANQFGEKRKSGPVLVINNSISTSKLKTRSAFTALSDEDKKVNYADEKIAESRLVVAPEGAASAKVEKEANEESRSCSSPEVCREDKRHEEFGCGILTEQKLPTAVKNHEASTAVKNEETALPTSSVNVLGVGSKAEKAIVMKAVNQSEQSEKQNIDLSSTILDHNAEGCEEKSQRKEVIGHCYDGSTSQEEPFPLPVQKTEWKSNAGVFDGYDAGGTGERAASVNGSGSAAGSDMAVKLDFDLNEGFPVDDGCLGDLAKPSVPESLSSVVPSPLPFTISSMSASFSPITIASAAKGPFFPPENPLRSKGELGWKGSAATSAFRPAEPRKALEMPLCTTGSPSVDNVTSKQGRPPLDFDLNEPDQRVLEDVASQSNAQVTCMEPGPLDCRGSGLDLDLNRIDESTDIGQFSVGNSCKPEIPQSSSRSSLSGGFSHVELNASRDFDLNNGPGPEEGVIEATPRARSNMSFLSPSSVGVGMSSMDQANFSSWFSPNNSYSAIAIPTILPGRGEQSYPIVPASGSQRISGPPTVGTSFASDFYRGPVLSSSPAIPFPPAATFQYQGFPFETNFSMSSNSYSGGSTAYVDSSSVRPLGFPAIPSQPAGTPGVVSHYPRPYMMNLQSGTSNIGPEGRKWGSQALDLNTGLGNTEVEWRDERLSSALRLSVPVSQASVDEQIKMHQMVGGVFKRKEPDSGWDGDRISHKHPSWQ